MINGNDEEKAPPYEAFLVRGSRPWAVTLVRSLKPGEPFLVPIRPDADIQTAQGQLSQTGRRLGIPLVTRVYEGQLWVCRLLDEDAHIAHNKRPSYDGPLVAGALDEIE